MRYGGCRGSYAVRCGPVVGWEKFVVFSIGIDLHDGGGICLQPNRINQNTSVEKYRRSSDRCLTMDNGCTLSGVS